MYCSYLVFLCSFLKQIYNIRRALSLALFLLSLIAIETDQRVSHCFSFIPSTTKMDPQTPTKSFSGPKGAKIFQTSIIPIALLLFLSTFVMEAKLSVCIIHWLESESSAWTKDRLVSLIASNFFWPRQTKKGEKLDTF